MLLGIISFTLSLFGWILLLGAPRVESHELNQVRFTCAMLVIFEMVALGFGAKLAFETQTWIAGHDYFECQSQILFLKRRKIYHASAWRLERLHHNGTYYALNPVGARVGMFFIPFWQSSQPRQALKLGRQLANVTGWPLRLSGEMQRLEKQLEKESEL